ncbi:MAG: NAD-dependent epimerase/dehydratase family protein [Actinomycetota bacterium]
MTVAITGATGVVGRAVLRHLLAAGSQVTALVRAGSDLPVGVGAAVGDVLNRESLIRAFETAEIVFHVAGINRLCQPDAGYMFEVNVEGTRNVLRAAAEAGVRRVVYTSSAATIGEASGAIGSEETLHRGYFNSRYERSKYEAEEAARQTAGRVELVIVNPSSVQGPGRATGTARLLLDLVNGRLSTLIDTRISVVDIDDCARGHLLAATHGEDGRRYLLNSFSMTMQEAVKLVEDRVGRPLQVRYLPSPIATVAGAVVGGVFGMLNKPGPLCPEMVRTLRHGHVYDGSRAARELGLVYTQASDTFARLLGWARREGLVK